MFLRDVIRDVLAARSVRERMEIIRALPAGVPPMLYVIQLVGKGEDVDVVREYERVRHHPEEVMDGLARERMPSFIAAGVEALADSKVIYEVVCGLSSPAIAPIDVSGMPDIVHWAGDDDRVRDDLIDAKFLRALLLGDLQEHAVTFVNTLWSAREATFRDALRAAGADDLAVERVKRKAFEPPTPDDLLNSLFVALTSEYDYDMWERLGGLIRQDRPRGETPLSRLRVALQCFVTDRR